MAKTKRFSANYDAFQKIFVAKSDKIVKSEFQERITASQKEILSETAPGSKCSNVTLATRLIIEEIQLSVCESAIRNPRRFNLLTKPFLRLFFLLTVVCIAIPIVYQKTHVGWVAAIAPVSILILTCLFYLYAVIILYDLYVQIFRIERDGREKSRDDVRTAEWLTNHFTPQALKALKDRQDDRSKLMLTAIGSSFLITFLGQHIGWSPNILDFKQPSYYVLCGAICVFYIPLVMRVRRSLRIREIATLAL